MKKITIGLCFGVLISLGFSFTREFTVSNKTADVFTTDSLMIFMESKPVKEYQVIGKVNSPEFTLNSTDYNNCKKHIIRRCKKNYPTAQGIILDFKVFPPNAEVIMFNK